MNRNRTSLISVEAITRIGGKRGKTRKSGKHVMDAKRGKTRRSGKHVIDAKRGKTRKGGST